MQDTAVKFFKDLVFGKTKTAAVQPSYPSDFRTPMSTADTMESKYGVAWLAFLPETIRALLKRDFNISDEVVFNKILATQTVLFRPSFEWDMFENICTAFNDRIPNFEIIEPLSYLELCWGYVCIKALLPTWEPDEDTYKYIETVVNDAGIVWVPWLPVSTAMDQAFKDKIKDTWKSPDKFTSDEAVGIQIDRLSVIQDYIKSWTN